MSNLSEDAKQALLQLASKLAYIDDQGQSYYDGLFDALYPLSSISAVYTPVGLVHSDDSLDSLKFDLVVTASYSDGTSGIIPGADYTLSGTLTVGTSTITVTYRSKTTTFAVTALSPVDYTLDAISGATWTTGYGYNTSTGALGAASNTYCTDKFTVQDCLYNVASTNSNDKNIRVFLWDASDNYIGYAGVNGRSISSIQLKPEYKCAIQFSNTNGDFDKDNVTMLPKDNRATAVDPFEIALYDYVNDLTDASLYGAIYCEIPLANYDVRDDGVTNANVTTTINKMSCLGTANGDALANCNFKSAFRAALRYDSTAGVRTLLVQVGGPSITTLADMKQYITDNRPVIRFN